MLNDQRASGGKCEHSYGSNWAVYLHGIFEDRHGPMDKPQVLAISISEFIPFLRLAFKFLKVPKSQRYAAHQWQPFLIGGWIQLESRNHTVAVALPTNHRQFWVASPSYLTKISQMLIDVGRCPAKNLQLSANVQCVSCFHLNDCRFLVVCL